jgi:hypothetical protein
MFPNLGSLSLTCVSILYSEKSKELTKWSIKSTKIESMKIRLCDEKIFSLLAALDKCRIKNVEIHNGYHGGFREVIGEFLTMQQKSLKKLMLDSCSDLLDNLKDLSLEHLTSGSFKYLGQQKDLKFLDLKDQSITSEVFRMIFQLQNLEELKINQGEDDDMNNLFKLKNLIRLKAYWETVPNIFEHLKFGTFSKLEELVCGLEGITAETANEISRCIPNLRKIEGHVEDSDSANNFLQSLHGLETLQLWGEEWKLTEAENIVCPSIRNLSIIIYPFDCDSVNKIAKMFPNLESLKIYTWPAKFNWTDSLILFLIQLKQLKKISLYDYEKNFQFDATLILSIIGDYGKNIEKVHLNVGMGYDEQFKKEIKSRVALGFEIWEKQGVIIEKILD